MHISSRESLSDPFTPDYKSGQEAFDSVGQAFGRGPDDEPRPMPHASGIKIFDYIQQCNKFIN